MSNINSATQQKIVNVINTATRSLSLAEIVNSVGAPTNTVRGSLTKLRSRGLVELGVHGWRRAATAQTIAQ